LWKAIKIVDLNYNKKYGKRKYCKKLLENKITKKMKNTKMKKKQDKGDEDEKGALWLQRAMQKL
jgi:hypothetical protein